MNDQIILIFYVDNIITTYDSKNQYQIDEFESKLMNKYEIQKLGEVEHFLGVRIVRDQSQRKLWLVQDSYIDKIAKKYNITLSTKPPKTPLLSIDLVLYKGTTIAQEIYAY